MPDTEEEEGLSRNIVSKVSNGSNKCLWPLLEIRPLFFIIFYNNMFGFFFNVSSFK